MKKPIGLFVVSIVCMASSLLCAIPIAMLEEDYDNAEASTNIMIIFMILLFVGLFLFMLATIKLAKYNKIQEAKKWDALSEEEKSEIKAQRLKERIEKENARTILKTKLIGQDAVKSTSSSVARGVVGGALFGVAGAVAGAMSGKNKRYCTFYVTYKDGHSETKTAEVDSLEFKIYMAYLKE